MKIGGIAKEALVQNFKAHNWHDAALLSLSVPWVKLSREQRIVADVTFVDQSIWQAESKVVRRRHTVEFLGCRLWRVEMDLCGKRSCSDHILEAFCHDDPTMIDELWMRFHDGILSPYSYDFRETHLFYRVRMISPGGFFELVAKGHSITQLEEAPTLP